MRLIMKNAKTKWFSISPLHMLAMLLLACSWGAEATAPRIAPGLFGEERKADIVGYQFAPAESAARMEADVAAEIVAEAFRAAGRTLAVDVLPSKQLAKYALLNNEAAALIGNQQDLSAKERGQYRIVTFFLRGDAPGEPVALILGRNARGTGLSRAFVEGLKKIVGSGKYLEIMEKHYGKGQVAADYFSRLKRHNPALK
jgi:hypothetical protein